MANVTDSQQEQLKKSWITPEIIIISETINSGGTQTYIEGGGGFTPPTPAQYVS